MNRNDPVRILIVANEAVECCELYALVRTHARGRSADVMVVAPALNTRLRHWVSDEDAAHAAAEERLARSIKQLNADGIAAHGWVGDADPLRAIDDALAIFPAEELIIATHPESQSNWLAHNVVGRAAESFGLPTAQVRVERIPAAA